MKRRYPAIAILIVAAVSCGRVSEHGQHAAVSAPFSYNQQMGWLHGPCLAISNPRLAAGTAVALVITGEPQKVGQARIQGPTDSSAICKPLLPGRAKMNAKAGTSFYALEGASIETTEMGFGIVAPAANPTVVNGLAQADLDRDGHSEVFTSCATDEGIQFAVWKDKAYQGEPRWSKYYYLDYDLKPNCP